MRRLPPRFTSVEPRSRPTGRLVVASSCRGTYLDVTRLQMQSLLFGSRPVLSWTTNCSSFLHDTCTALDAGGLPSLRITTGPIALRLSRLRTSSSSTTLAHPQSHSSTSTDLFLGFRRRTRNPHVSAVPTRIHLPVCLRHAHTALDMPQDEGSSEPLRT